MFYVSISVKYVQSIHSFVVTEFNCVILLGLAPVPVVNFLDHVEIHRIVPQVDLSQNGQDNPLLIPPLPFISDPEPFAQPQPEICFNPVVDQVGAPGREIYVPVLQHITDLSPGSWQNKCNRVLHQRPGNFDIGGKNVSEYQLPDVVFPVQYDLPGA
jgi:hypothetical protein